MIIPNIWENKKCSKPPTRDSWAIAGGLQEYHGWLVLTSTGYMFEELTWTAPYQIYSISQIFKAASSFWKTGLTKIPHSRVQQTIHESTYPGRRSFRDEGKPARLLRSQGARGQGSSHEILCDPRDLPHPKSFDRTPLGSILLPLTLPQSLGRLRYKCFFSSLVLGFPCAAKKVSGNFRRRSSCPAVKLSDESGWDGPHYAIVTDERQDIRPVDQQRTNYACVQWGLLPQTSEASECCQITCQDGRGLWMFWGVSRSSHPLISNKGWETHLNHLNKQKAWN